MHLLTGLHGTLAAVVICAILFADEAGVPIPFIPNEVLLLITGVLIQSQALNAWIFYPVALVVMTAGMVTGYAWAHTAGQYGLERLVYRVGAGGMYTRAVTRLRAAGPVGIGIARLLPGIRPWATLIAGATGIDPRRFLTGALPALLLWELGWITLGRLVGLPAEHFLGRFEKLAFRGAVLLVLGSAGYVGIRRLRTEGVLALRRRGLGLLLALLITDGTTASIVAGALAVARGLGRFRGGGWIDLLVILVLLAADTILTLRQYRSGKLGIGT